MKNYQNGYIGIKIVGTILLVGIGMYLLLDKIFIKHDTLPVSEETTIVEPLQNIPN